eukprot:JP435811.1.p2 GENE.JP435811.1~~JP435811.1.p2  ORF type:complete len:405 (+),score=184.09 JP435811.1:1-1215(+)
MGNPRAFKALIAAKYNNVALNHSIITEKSQFKNAEYTAKHPLGKLPILETADGVLFESGAIVRYIARIRADTELFGNGFFQAGEVDQFVDFAASELDSLMGSIILPVLGCAPPNKQAMTAGLTTLNNALALLEKRLATKTFLVGEKVTLADICVVCSLANFFKTVLDTAARKPFPNVVRWYMTCVNQPEFAAVLGPISLIDKAMQPAAAKKEKAPKKEAAPKTEKKKKEPEPEDDFDDIPKEEEKPKGPHWSTLIPKSSMVLDDWKRLYSNNETKDILPKWWEMLDTEGYSLWYAVYKYNEDNKKLFMTNNLVGGFFQRLDPVRKYAFGSCVIAGEEPELEITGVWLFRGQDLPPELLAVDDTELYEWTKLDPKDPAVKSKVENYWCWEGTFNGKPFGCGKIFK